MNQEAGGAERSAAAPRVSCRSRTADGGGGGPVCVCRGGCPFILPKPHPFYDCVAPQRVRPEAKRVFSLPTRRANRRTADGGGLGGRRWDS